MVYRGNMEIGVFVVFFAYLKMMYGPITGLTRFYHQVQRALASCERVFSLLDTKPDIVDAPDAIEIASINGQVEFRDVEFSYTPEVPVIRGVQLQAAPGEMIAFVGPSGSGKTTLTNLLLRFYDPSNGKILIDDMDLRSLNQASLKRHIAIVQQEPFLFNDTIRANIAYARPEATDTEIESAAKAANAESFITELPDGYQCLIGERGVKLSGGQRQRLAIARAILADPSILILDEATSAVDTETEVLIQEAIDRLVENRTTFVVAHRLSTVQHADQILVLDQGQVVQRGTHEELVNQEGLYQRLNEAQFQNSSPSSRRPANRTVESKTTAEEFADSDLPDLTTI